MSSYLNVYIKPKDKDEKILLYSFSRNSDIYQFFYDNNLSCYVGNSDECKFKKLDLETLKYSMMDLNDEIIKAKEKLSIMKEQKEDINDIISFQEDINEQTELKYNIDMIELLVNKYAFNDVECVYTNYD